MQSSSESDHTENVPIKVPGEKAGGGGLKRFKGLLHRRQESLLANEGARKLVKQQEKESVQRDIDEQLSARDSGRSEKKMFKDEIRAIQKQAVSETSEERENLKLERKELKTQKSCLKKMERDEEKLHKQRKREMKEKEKEIEKQRKKMKTEEKSKAKEDQIRILKQLEVDRAMLKKQAKDEKKMNKERKKEAKEKEKEIQREKKRIEKEEEKKYKQAKKDAFKNYMAQKHNLHFWHEFFLRLHFYKILYFYILFTSRQCTGGGQLGVS